LKQITTVNKDDIQTEKSAIVILKSNLNLEEPAEVADNKSEESAFAQSYYQENEPSAEQYGEMDDAESEDRMNDFDDMEA
jgi:hypothetical protein